MSDLFDQPLLRVLRGDPDAPDVTADTWPSLLRLADRLDVAGLVAYAALRRASSLPSAVQGECSSRLTAISRHHGFHVVEAERVASLLAAHRIPLVVLKGVALARTAYEHPACRAFRDLDILVPPSEVDRALSLLAVDYRIACDPRLLDAYRRHHFHVPLDAPGKPRLELHWAVTRPDDPYRLEADTLFSDASVPQESPRFPCPHPDAQVLLATVALLRCGFAELKRLVDLDRLSRPGRPAIRWPRVARLAEEYGLSPALRLYVELTADLLGSPLEEPLALLPPLGRTGALLHRLGVPGFPFGAPPSASGPARHLVRGLLVSDRGRVFAQYLYRPNIDRARMVAQHVSPFLRAIAVTKRFARLLGLFFWLLTRRKPA